MEEVVEAIAGLRDHGKCECSVCEMYRKVVAENPAIASTLVKLVQ
jgi:hypothetical protein